MKTLSIIILFVVILFGSACTKDDDIAPRTITTTSDTLYTFQLDIQALLIEEVHIEIIGMGYEILEEYTFTNNETSIKIPITQGRTVRVSMTKHPQWGFTYMYKLIKPNGGVISEKSNTCPTLCNFEQQILN